MTSLENIIAVGVARYQANYAPRLTDVADVEAQPNVSGVDEKRQRELCLSCPLAECVDIADSRCPIRIEQRQLWRNRRQP